MPRRKTDIHIESIPKKVLSTREACAYLDCSNEFLEELRNNALVSFSRYKRNKFWYDLASLDRFIEKHKII